MNQSVNLSTILKLLEELKEHPKDVNILNKTIKSNDFDRVSVVKYILNNSFFYDVFCNFNPDLAETEDKELALKSVVSKLETVSLRNILFTCSILAMNENETTKLFIKKIIMSSYICRDIIEKVNFYRNAKHNPENFFLYALFHDIGEILVATFFEDEVKKNIYKNEKSIDLSAINNIAPHNEIGYMMVRKWQLPSIFSYICLNHNKLEYRKFSSDFIYIINAIAVSDAVALELLDYEIPFTNTWDVGHSIYKIGLREDDIYTESGIIGSVSKKIDKIMSLFNLK